MAITDAKTIGRVNQFKVYQCVRKIMEDESRCPTAIEVSGITGIVHSTVCRHMSSIAKADGLPLHIQSGVDRTGSARTSNTAWKLAQAGSTGNMVRGMDFDENNIPVDVLIGGDLVA